MSPFRKSNSLAEHYDQSLRINHDHKLPEGYARPQPSALWPKENIALYERYRDWLLSGGTCEHSSKTIYLPIAGIALGLNLKPHGQLELGADLDRALDYVIAKQSGPDWIKASRNGLNLFRRFMRLERGLGEESRIAVFDIPAHTQGLPLWLVSELERHQRIQQRNWRTARIDLNLRSFWSKHTCVWRFLCLERGVQQLADLKRQHILDYLDARLKAKLAISGINTDLRLLHSFLLFLQEEGYAVPQSLMHIPSLKLPDSLPKYLTDEQVKKLRLGIERAVQTARLPSHRRLVLLERATFFLMWQGGLRLGEVEELRLEDLNLPGRRLSVRSGKGLKDRTIYLTGTAVAALGDYLEVRGTASSDHVFLYRNRPVNKDLIRSRLKEAGERVGVKVNPHRLRHTCATQLLNAGCRITSIQAYLGHKKLNTTMIYAHAYDQTVAEDYFTAMERVEQRLEIGPKLEIAQETGAKTVNELPTSQMMVWVEQLALPELCQRERLEIAESLKQALSLNYVCELSPPMELA